MTQFRRQVLDGMSPFEDTNAGLWLNKYLLNDNEDAKKNLVYQVFEKIKLQESYKNFYEKWKAALESRGAVTKVAKTLGRLAVNLGAEATLENSIALNRTYGVPCIPGSALKGLSANYARNSLDGWKDTLAYKDIFGEQDNAGYVNFYDALYVPDGKLGLVPDVVTVHHQEYYQKDNVPPADWDSPIPIHFLSVSGSFLIALSGPTEKLVQAAFDILALALAHEGIGAKTSSGYGRMEVEGFDFSGNGEKKSKVENPPLVPPKGADWKKGRTSRDGRSVYPADSTAQKLHFRHEHVLPKGFTPAQKSDVEYLEETLPDGSLRVWVKKLHYPVD